MSARILETLCNPLGGAQVPPKTLGRARRQRLSFDFFFTKKNDIVDDNLFCLFHCHFCFEL